MRVRKLIKRVLLGLLAFVVVGISGVLIYLHTDSGREMIRGQLQEQLAKTFYGDVSIGRIEGSPLGTMTVHDIVIEDAEGKPAIAIAKLEAKLALFQIVTHKLVLQKLTADGVAISARKDRTGKLNLAGLIRPGPKSTWLVALPNIEVHRGRIAIALGDRIEHIDDVELSGNLEKAGDKLTADVQISGRWRERAAPWVVRAAVRGDEGVINMPIVTADTDGIFARIANVRIANQTIAGTGTLHATRAGIRKLAPKLELPNADVFDLSFDASAIGTTSRVQFVGLVDRQAVRGDIEMQLADRHFAGSLSAPEIDLARLSRGKIPATAGGTVLFDATLGDTRLPRGRVVVHGHGTYRDVPMTRATVWATSDGTRVGGAIDAVNPGLVASLSGELTVGDKTLILADGKLRATSKNLSRAVGRTIPASGRLDVDLVASGRLTPRPEIAVKGTIDGRALRAKDLSIATVDVAVDAARLPARPYGTLDLRATDVVRGNLWLKELTLKARDRADGKIAAALRTRPKQDPWLIEADALIAPSRQQVTIDLTRHFVRAGAGGEWAGNTGRLTVTRERIELAGFTSKSREGAIAAAGHFHRAGRNAGDVAAKVDATHIALANYDPTVTGTIDAHVDVARRAGKLTGDAMISARGISKIHEDAAGVATNPAGRKLVAVATGIDAELTARLDGTELSIEGQVTGDKTGTARLQLAIKGPAAITDVDAWKRLPHTAIQDGVLELQKVDVAALLKVAGAPDYDIAIYRGTLDGRIQFPDGHPNGKLGVRNLITPHVRGLGAINADLDLRTAGNTLSPTLVATLDRIGSVTAKAEVNYPERRFFDPASWGRKSLRRATVSARDLAIDPGRLDMLRVYWTGRGRASFDAELVPDKLTAKLALRDLRGSPVAKPVAIDVAATVAGTIDARILASADNAHLLDARVKIPASLDELFADPGALRDKPITADSTSKAPAATVLGLFGRTEVTGGMIEGTAKVTGTVGAPQAVAKFIGTGIQVPPGPGGKPIQTVQRVTVDASWKDRKAVLTVDAVEDRGSLKLAAQVIVRTPDALPDGSVSLTSKNFDLQPILAFAPGPAGGGAGRLDAKLELRGFDPRTAQIAGEAHLREGRIPLAPAVGTLRRANVDIVIKGREVAVTVDGKLGDGTVKGSGSVSLDGAAPYLSGGSVKLTLRKVSPIGVVEPLVDADVEVWMRREPDHWRADVSVTNGFIKVPSDRSEPLAPAGAPPDMRFENTRRITRRPLDRGEPARPALVARIVIARTKIESDELRGTIRGKITVTADGETVGMLGVIEADRGDLDLFGRRYRVDRAAVRFDGKLDPILDVQIVHDFPEVTTITEVRGRASKPRLIMKSEPPLYTQGQLLGFLLGGEPSGDPGSARDRATGAGASFVANKIGGYVKSFLPIDLDVLRYEHTTASSSAAVTVGTWLRHDLFLAYRRHLEARPDENAGEGELEYWIGKRVVIEGVVGDRNRDSVDLLWRKRY